MKDLAFLAVLLGLALVWYLTTRNREGFAAEFTDLSNAKRTDDMSSSSFKQETNHFPMTRPMMEPPSGIETPFRVNQYHSFMDA